MASLTKGTFLMMRANDTYELTKDTTLTSGKTYYTRSGSSGSYVYTEVSAPNVSNISTYYEVKAGEYTKVIDITEYPDMGKDPDTVDITTLSHPMHVYIDALPDPGGVLGFPGFFESKESFMDLKKIEGATQHFALWIGGDESADGATITPTGDKLKIKFDGTIQVRLNGAKVGEAIPVQAAITVGSKYIYE